MIYACGNGVMEGDTVERITLNIYLTIGNTYTVVVPPKGGYIEVKEVPDEGFDPEYFKLIKRKEKEMLQRDQEYDLKLTGEQLAWIYLYSGQSFNSRGIYDVVANLIEDDMSMCMPESIKFTEYNGLDGLLVDCVNNWLDKVFTIPETEDQRKLRELKEQYAKLGDSIKAMEKK